MIQFTKRGRQRAEIEVDNFAGGGGASTGMKRATGRSPAIAINHDPLALEMHKANHPETRHLLADVFSVDPKKATSPYPADAVVRANYQPVGA